MSHIVKSLLIWVVILFFLFLGVIYILFSYYLFFIIYRRNGGCFAREKRLFCFSWELVLCFGVVCLFWSRSFVSGNWRKKTSVWFESNLRFELYMKLQLKWSMLLNTHKLKRKQSPLCNTVFQNKQGRGELFWATTDNGSNLTSVFWLWSCVEQSIGKVERK